MKEKGKVVGSFPTVDPSEEMATEATLGLAGEDEFLEPETRLEGSEATSFIVALNSGAAMFGIGAHKLPKGVFSAFVHSNEDHSITVFNGKREIGRDGGPATVAEYYVAIVAEDGDRVLVMRANLYTPSEVRVREHMTRFVEKVIDNFGLSPFPSIKGEVIPT